MELPDGRTNPKKRRRSATILEPIDQIFGPSHHDPTVFESPPEVRSSSPPKGRSSSPPQALTSSPPQAQSSSPPGDSHQQTPLLRPSLRPPMAVLCAFDDDQESGEIVRIRVPAFVIGRSDGGLIIPHDAGISGRHAEIGRRLAGDRYRWYLRDLGSTNGTFARVARAVLREDQEFLIGGTRFRFESGREGEPPARSFPEVEAAGSRDGRPRPSGRRREHMTPVLVEIRPDGEPRRFVLSQGETWIGRDAAACRIVIDQQSVAERHAVIKTRKNGRLMIENAGSRDGVWLRINEVDLGRGAQFQCGEQRFAIRIV